MNGRRYLLDTNAIIRLLQGDTGILKVLGMAEWVGISIISELEFLSFPNLLEQDKALFRQFLERVDVIGLAVQDREFIDSIINLRQRYRLKLPDAIIAASALTNRASLITLDRRFLGVQDLEVLDFKTNE